MVAAEAACCGALPLSASHSGLAEVTAALAGSVEPEIRSLLSFQRGPGAVQEIAEKLVGALRLAPGQRARAAQSLSAEARRRYGWESVAEGVIAAAQGRLQELAKPGAPAPASGGPSK